MQTVFLALLLAYADNAVSINTDFSGGNVKVIANDANVVEVAPDLRGDSDWFYWYFQATAQRPGSVRFVFPKKVAGHVNGAIGKQGPAISTDDGKTWRWMGTDTVEENAFTYTFTQKGETVRLAVTIPYVQSNLDQFLKQNRNNKHLSQTVLTQSKHHRDVELLTIGTPDENKSPMILTCRHHAVETMASFLLEGMIQQAIADTPEGQAFRDKYVLYVVPFVDKDGVEEGDQGKNRKPHDHNRDYGDNSIYPEIQAIKELQQKVKFRFALDLHCPTLVYADHQVIYFVGAKEMPKGNQQLVAAFADRIKAELPKDAPAGPLVWLRDETDESPKSSRYFAFQEGAVMSATLEFPFAPPKKKTDPASCREYGQGILRAFTAMNFTPPETKK